jgi:hypothetical protein
MPLDKEGNWYPLLFDRQLEVFNSKARALLVCGPRLSGKTWAVLARIVRHLWDTPGARVAMFSRTMKNAKDGGTWMDMHNITLPEWINSGIGMEYTTLNADGVPGWKTDGSTRTPYFRVSNRWGGQSEVRLFSLDFDDGIEDKLKEQRFSLIYFSELSKFRDRKVLSIALPALRMPHLKMADQMWIADTNPGEEGESSWIYETWYMERLLSYDQYCDYFKERGRTPLGETEFRNFQSGLELIEIKPEENPFIEPAVIEELKATYAYDAGLYARYVKGLWVYGDGDSSRHFRTAFRPNIHVVGDCSAPNSDDWIYLNPSENCYELITGWDLGDVNHAAVAMEKMYLNNVLHFVVLEELESIETPISIEEFTQEFVGLIEWLDSVAGKKLLTTSNWSDRSSIEKYSATADTFPYLEVYAASNERIYLQGVPKGRGSVKVRVQLLKQLLVQGRIKFSAHLTGLHRMLRDLKKGKGKLDYVISDENKHLFDALTYPLLMECADDLDSRAERSLGKRPSLSVSV